MSKSRIDSILKNLISKPKLTSTVTEGHRRTLSDTASNPMVKPFLSEALSALLKVAGAVLKGLYGVIGAFL